MNEKEWASLLNLLKNKRLHINLPGFWLQISEQISETDFKTDFRFQKQISEQISGQIFVIWKKHIFYFFLFLRKREDKVLPHTW